MAGGGCKPTLWPRDGSAQRCAQSGFLRGRRQRGNWPRCDRSGPRCGAYFLARLAAAGQRFVLRTGTVTPPPRRLRSPSAGRPRRGPRTIDSGQRTAGPPTSGGLVMAVARVSREAWVRERAGSARDLGGRGAHRAATSRTDRGAGSRPPEM